MKASCAVVLLGLLAVVAAHYDGYPFTHQNGGRYGVAYPYANYAQASYGAPAAGYGNGYGYGFNNEFTYRGFGAYPVHVGNGHFYYLGQFNGQCSEGYNYGFYFAGDANSFVVCDHGRAHTFQCPKGTANRDTESFTLNHRYGMHELCGVNTLH